MSADDCSWPLLTLAEIDRLGCFCRMSDAVEGAEVILYGVSKRYKESANCRLEANYGHQQG